MYFYIAGMCQRGRQGGIRPPRFLDFGTCLHRENFPRTRVSHGFFSKYLTIKVLFISKFNGFHRVSCVMGFHLSITAYLSLVKIKLQSCTDSSKLQFFWQMHSNISKSRLFSHDKVQGRRIFSILLDATIHRVLSHYIRFNHTLKIIFYCFFCQSPL